MSEVEVRPDRVSVGMGFKRNMKNYQSMDIHISFSSDAGKEEDAEKLLNRVYDFVESQFLARFEETEQELKEIQSKGK
jgi:tRNA A-37 threonylcarbamoyl transferase component Bud32